MNRAALLKLRSQFAECGYIERPNVCVCYLAIRRRKSFTKSEAKKIGTSLRVDFKRIPLTEFHRGLNVELEHGLRDPKTNLTWDDPYATAMIALAHLNERPDYYTRLRAVE